MCLLIIFGRIVSGIPWLLPTTGIEMQLPRAGIASAGTGVGRASLQ